MSTVSLTEALSRGHGTWRSFTCPSHPDANPSARVNVQSGKWVCMVCGAKGTVDGHIPDVDWMLEQALEGLGDGPGTKPESWLDQYDSGPVPHYWLSRFSEEVCRTFRLGWDQRYQQPCYPLRAHNGLPLGVVRRNIDDPDGPKYKYPRGVNTSGLLFGVKEAQQTDVLLLVEGAMDVCAVREAGHDALGTYGSRLYDKQVEQIAGLAPRVVYIAYDMDRAGKDGAFHAERDLQKVGVMAWAVEWNDRYKDLGEMDLDTRCNTLAKILA